MLMQSIFDIFKIGIGPSSSHTMGPMKAAGLFLKELQTRNYLDHVDSVKVNLHGSLALTGKGHLTDKAVLLGLTGAIPETIDLDSIPHTIQSIKKTGLINLAGTHQAKLNPADDIKFVPKQLPLHENGLVLTAFDKDKKELFSKTYYSVGGGFIADSDNFGAPDGTKGRAPYPFSNGQELVWLCSKNGFSISTLVLKNECAIHHKTKDEIIDYFDTRIWGTMNACMKRGLTTEGILPGKLKLARRAAPLRRLLKSSRTLKADPMNIIDWVNLFALAVSEENAVGGRIVTAPTSGACGVVPAVLAYYDHFIHKTKPEDRARYLMTCGAIGLLYKMNASISGAEVGCQGEIGVACSMAAAGLTELSASNPHLVATAAEIAMEHSLGMTCDPIAGLVQVPCIERNAVAAVKAINSSHMAILRTSAPRVSLDNVIRTMYQTGKDLSAKYRETSEGGLAVNCG